MLLFWMDRYKPNAIICTPTIIIIFFRWDLIYISQPPSTKKHQYWDGSMPLWNPLSRATAQEHEEPLREKVKKRWKNIWFTVSPREKVRERVDKHLLSKALASWLMTLYIYIYKTRTVYKSLYSMKSRMNRSSLVSYTFSHVNMITLWVMRVTN